MGLSNDESFASLRFSLGKFSTDVEINEALFHLKKIINHDS